MDREKLRKDMLNRLLPRRHETARIDDALLRLEIGLSDATKCPICFYLHGREAVMVRVNSPIGQMGCGYEERGTASTMVADGQVYGFPLPPWRRGPPSKSPQPL